jgi:hypothetical protein
MPPGSTVIASLIVLGDAATERRGYDALQMRAGGQQPKLAISLALLETDALLRR